MFVPTFPRRLLCWLNAPAGLLVVLLQRTPAVRVVAGISETVLAAPAGQLLRAAFAASVLGAVDSLAGATTLRVQQNQTIIVQVGDPPQINVPISGTVNTPLAPIVFVVTGATQPPGSYEIKNLPPGLTVPGINSSGVLNFFTGSISGTPTTAGTFRTTILAWEFSGGPATRANDFFPSTGPITLTFNITGGASTAPAITAQPAGQVVGAGGSVTFSVSASGSPAPAFQWQRNGTPIAGATAAVLALSNVLAADAGDYTVVVSNSAGTITSSVATLAVLGSNSGARLANLSVRTTMAANQTLIVGFVVDGGARDVLVRAAGPALAAFGLSAAMADPRLELFRDSVLVFSNDNWPATLAPSFADVGAFAFTAGSKDAALLQPISGAHSIFARGTGPGVVLVEAYDASTGGTARLVNVSARNRVGTGDDVLIAGFNVAGTGSKQLLIRAIGPKLETFGVGGVLADPKLEIFSDSTKIAENDNWSASLAPTFAAVGAFALEAGSRDAALVVALSPGSYTVQVAGVGGTTGEALVEVYEVP